MFKKLLVAYEGSDYADQAFNVAIEIAAGFKAQIYVVSVIEIPAGMYTASAEFVNSVTAHYTELHANLTSIAEKNNLQVTYEIAMGLPEESIVSYAIEQQIDLIVIGVKKKRSFLEKLVMGSVSKEVVMAAECSVLVVR